MALTRTKPQQVVSDEGWQLESAGREAVLYREGDRVVVVGVDRGVPTTRVYVDDLVRVGGAGQQVVIGPAERERVLQRVVEGMACLGIAVELFSRET